MHVTAIALAAGRGLRFKSKIAKPLAKINSTPVIVYSLLRLSKHPWIRDIIVVANAKNSKEISAEVRKYHIGKISRIVKGGRRRQDSVYCGLKALNQGADLVLIHDVARPFIDRETVSSVIKEAKRCGAAIVGVPVKATIKEVTKSQSHKVTGKIAVKKTLNREKFCEIQTPQVFDKELLLKAYKKFGDTDVTDDAMLVEKLGVKVSVVLGSYLNIKITTPEDLILAQAIVRHLRCQRE